MPIEQEQMCATPGESVHLFAERLCAESVNTYERVKGEFNGVKAEASPWSHADDIAEIFMLKLKIEGLLNV